MKTEVKEIKFYDDTLLGVKDESGQIWLAVRKTCRDIGLSDAQGRAEVTKIQQSLLFKDNCKKLSLKFETQMRETLVLGEKFVPMWLAQINLTPSMQKKNPNAVQKLLKYQLEAADVLHKAFYESTEQKTMFHSNFDLHGEINDISQKIQQIGEKVTEQVAIITDCAAIFQNMINYATINYQQQNELLRIAKERVNILLDGAKSPVYKKHSRVYFKNLWLNFCDFFGCDSYKNLNPLYLEMAKDWILEWNYYIPSQKADVKVH